MKARKKECKGCPRLKEGRETGGRLGATLACVYGGCPKGWPKKDKECSKCPAYNNICAGGITWNLMCIDFHKKLSIYVKEIKNETKN